MDIVKSFIPTLCDSNIVVELEDETWMRIIESKGRYVLTNSTNSMTLYFHKPDECFRFVKMSIKKHIHEIVYNSVNGNMLVYKKNCMETDREAAELLLLLNKC